MTNACNLVVQYYQVAMVDMLLRIMLFGLAQSDLEYKLCFVQKGKGTGHSCNAYMPGQADLHPTGKFQSGQRYRVR